MSSQQPSETTVEIHGNTLTLRGDTLDRQANAAARASSSSSGAEAPAPQHLLITLSDTSPETHKAIQATGATVLSFISDGVFLYKHRATADVASLQKIRGVRYVDVYPASVKVQANLRSSVSNLLAPSGDSHDAATTATAAATVPIEIHFHKGTSESAMQNVLDRLGSSGYLETDSIQTFTSMAVATARADRISEIAEAPEIYVIQQKPTYVEDNFFATDVLGVSGPILMDGGYQIYPDAASQPGDPCRPYDGSGETICIGDTGFDRGSTIADMADFSGIHPAFSIRNANANAYSFYCMDASHDATPTNVSPSCFIDVKGHGTHVCGSAVGSSQTPSISGANNAGYIKGSAPGARLIFTQLKIHNTNPLDTDPRNKPFYPGPMVDIYRKTIKAVHPGSPPPIFSQSWNNDWNDKNLPKPGYCRNAEVMDTVLRDEDTLMCRSAGNDGDVQHPYPGICGWYAAGKNVLTVGSCNSSTSQWTQDFADVTSNYARDPPQPRALPGNPRVVAPNSCAGTQEGRQKPDVVAPGVGILSALSRDADPPKPPSPPASPLPTPLDKSYCFKSGTSMATPLAAGCAAVISQALRLANPSSYTSTSGTLLKALLINGATSIVEPKDQNGFEPQQFAKGTTQRWGFGRVNVLGSLSHLPLPNGGSRNGTIGGYGRGTLMLGNNTNKASFALTVPKPEPTPGCLVDDSSPNKSVKVTLCYADEGNKALQALFYFTLTEKDTGRVRFGNKKGWVSQDDAADPVQRAGNVDTINNVQQIFCTDAEPGHYTIDVEYFKNNTGQVPGPTVPYAVAWLVY
ncbi:peptidase S8/S53 domain-containing protein [Echria macrotheca]|uniref:Peptidase S8/S53 domain-containing protein n=1 Tax=Echria macrotheca TaxID=438768 RepID=A0AAJ0BAS0_9PEZI|nr:peptidase S8/S53 domain-containing protein [Echria macrotheca]